MAHKTNAYTEPVARGAPNRLRVLVSAFACEPGRGSEPGTGWNVVRDLTRHHDLHVITRACYRRSIEAAVAAEGGSLATARFVYLDLPEEVTRVMNRPSVGENLYYALWQWRLRAFARALHKRERFDVGHHVTFVRYWMAPGLSWVPDLPVVFGPVGGGDSTPPPLERTLSLGGRVFEVTRALTRWGFVALPSLPWAIRRMAVSIATTPATAARLRALGAPDVRIMSDVHARAEDLPSVERRAQLQSDAYPRSGALCVGRMIEWKAYHLAIEAWARADVPGSLELFGDGPSLPGLRALVARLGIADRVVFHGRRPREQVLEALSRVRMLIHPSLHDSGGWAVLESLQNGVPVVCWNHAGPGQNIDETCGVAVDVDAAGANPSIDKMAEAVRLLANDDDAWRRLSAGAFERVERHLTWEGHGERLGQLFHDVVRSSR